MPRYSANLHFLFTELPFIDRFAAARAAGFDAVEFPDPYRHDQTVIADRLAEHDLSCVLLNAPAGDPERGEKGLAGLPGRQAEFQTSIGVAIEAALRLGAPRVNVMAGIQPPGTAAQDCQLALVESLGFAAREFAKVGLTVCLEALNTVDVPGYLVSHVDQALEILKLVGQDNVRFQFDLYHLFVMEPDVLAALERALPQVAHVQLADHPGRHEPGTGNLPWREAMGLLDRRGYSGHVGAEYHPSRRTEASLGWRT